MEEVSSRIFAFYSEGVARRGLPLEVLTDGLPSIERVRNKGASWYDWTDHVVMLSRFQVAMGGPAAVDQAALEANERRVAERLRAVVRSIADVSLVYRAGFWFGGSLYRHIKFKVDADVQLLRVEISIPDKYEGSEIFFRMWRGTLRGTPRMIGLPDATVTSEISSHHGVYNILPPEGRDVLTRARRFARVARESTVLVTHLEKHDQELRDAYDTLLRSRQDFREIAHNTPDALMLLRAGSIVYANPVAIETIGTGKLAHLVHADDRSMLRAWLTEAERSGAGGRLDFRVGPRMFEAEVARTVDFAGDDAILVLARDVSARKAAESQLRRSEQDKRGLLEAVPDLIIRISGDGIIMDVAGQACHPVAPLLRERTGMPFSSIADDLVDLPTNLATRLSEGASLSRPEAFVLETPTMLAQGQERLVLEWRSVAIDDGAVVCVVRDLSHQRRMESELAMAERLASLGMLAAGVGHEINNPLAYLLLQLRLMQKAINTHSSTSLNELSSHVVAALEGVDHIQRVVRSLKALAQQAPAIHHAVDVNSVIEEMVRLTENRVPPGVVLRREYESDVWALADEGPLGQVFANVFVNAMDAIAATGGKGEIRLATRTRADRNQIEIEVTDTGVGMPEGAIRKAFDPFFTTKPPSSGLGLGLTLAHRMVTSLEGTISIERGLMGGTTITIRLRRSEAGSDAARISTPLPSSQQRFNGAAVLVIDDQPNLVRTLKMLLDECVVTSAKCGEEALGVIERSPFDLILCDIVMPDIDGVRIFERLTKQAPTLLPKLIFMSGGAIRPEIEAFLARIPNAYLQKPFTEERLRQVMAHTLHAMTLSAPLMVS